MLRHRMPVRNMPDLVTEYTYKISLTVQMSKHAAGEVNITSRHRKGIYDLGIQNAEMEIQVWSV